MGYGQILLFFFMCWLSYFVYWLLSRGPPRQQGFWQRPSKITNRLKNLNSKKHWTAGERVNIADDDGHAGNIYRVAGNTFGDTANRDCLAFLVPEGVRGTLNEAVSVVVDGLRVGNLSARDLIPFNAILHEEGLHSEVTSCDAHIGGGGTGVDGKKRRYTISLNVNWFEN